MINLPAWQVMWGLAFLIYVAYKLTTWWEAGCSLTPRGLGYLFAWPGLDARTFLRSEEASRPDEREWTFALAKTFLGSVILFGLARKIPYEQQYLTGWVGMVGIVFILHFGLFHLLSCAWKSIDVNAEPLMNWPIASKNLSDFWGKRWNTAFRNLTHKFLFAPLLRKLGRTNYPIAVLLSFAFSGVVHDLVISLPAGGGYGGPTLFFLIQGFGILLEWYLRRVHKLNGWWGRAYAATFLVLPACLLFHPPFVLNVVVPFMRASGALP